jgi:ribosomal protein S18 acetylase RimI-like enzyme
MTPWAYRTYKKKPTKSRSSVAGFLSERAMIHFDIEDPTTVDAAWCFKQYFGELNDRFDGGFDPDRSISANAHELTEPRGVLVVARRCGEPIGCGALKFGNNQIAELKRMWVAPEVRGVGVGRRILTELERLGAKAGIHVVRLETNRALSEAISLYRASGYSEVNPFNAEPYAHHWFEERLP